MQEQRSAAAIFEEAVAHHQAGRLSEAEAYYFQVLALDPTHAESLHLLGLAAHQSEKNALAVDCIRKAISLQPSLAHYHFNLAVILALLDRTSEAEECLHVALKLRPGYAEAHNNLGNIFKGRGHLTEAMASYRAALSANGNYVEAHYNVGLVLQELGHLADAEQSYRVALGLKPDHPLAHNNLGNVLKETGRIAEAESAYRAALHVRPDYSEAHFNLGTVLNGANAEASYRSALRLRPDFPEAHYNLAVVLQGLGRLDEAEAACREALRLDPNFAEAHSNLGVVLQDLGRMKEAEVCFRGALRAKPDYAVAHSNLIFALGLIPDISQAALNDERRRWYRLHGKKFSSLIQSHGSSRDPDRRLRVGYVSADFRHQSAAYAFGPILRHHDHARFEVICYSSVPLGLEDQMTFEFRKAADQWRDIGTQDDEVVTSLIRSDRVDILVDLSAHNSGNRLLVFARKPAPIQIAAWNNCWATLMPTMDYMFGDPVAVPSATRQQLDEMVIDLPCWIVYEAPAAAPAIAPLHGRTGPTTFGCLNRIAKLSDATLDLWGLLFRALPGARLLLKDHSLGESSVRVRILSALAARGISAERVLLMGGSGNAEHLMAYGQVDVALDPFPDSGGISTLEALWMGVPVVTLPGSTGSSRGTAAILSALGLQDWIAENTDEYVQIAVALATDSAHLASWREKLRPLLAKSPVGDAAQYTRAVEASYRDVWHRWCRAKGMGTIGARQTIE